jgi:ArsR family transcriptional regulator, arsenate/arsenite/antimonite-responsive transcriptional repressor
MKDSIWKALSDPTRREIIKILGEGEMSAGDLTRRFEISGPSMSHHFNVLREAGVVSARRQGQQIYYALDTTVVQDLLAVLLDLFSVQEVPERSKT